MQLKGKVNTYLFTDDRLWIQKILRCVQNYLNQLINSSGLKDTKPINLKDYIFIKQLKMKSTLSSETKTTQRNLPNNGQDIYTKNGKLIKIFSERNYRGDQSSQEFHVHRLEQWASPRSNSSVAINAIKFNAHIFWKILTQVI